MSLPEIEQLRERAAGLRQEHRRRLLREARWPWPPSLLSAVAILLAAFALIQTGGSMPDDAAPWLIAMGLLFGVHAEATHRRIRALAELLDDPTDQPAKSGGAPRQPDVAP